MIVGILQRHLDGDRRGRRFTGRCIDGGGISSPISSAGGATLPPHCRFANSASQYAGLGSRTIDAKRGCVPTGRARRASWFSARAYHLSASS